MNIDVSQMIYDLEDENGWNQLITELDNLHLQLLGIVEISETWATTEQMCKVCKISKNWSEYRYIGAVVDYDYDGVINVDKCPDTPISQINNVNAQGCAW